MKLLKPGQKSTQKLKVIIGLCFRLKTRCNKINYYMTILVRTKASSKSMYSPKKKIKVETFLRLSVSTKHLTQQPKQETQL